MKDYFFRSGICLALILAFTACEKQEAVPEGAAVEYFIAKDLSFLQADLPDRAAKGWPVNGCKEFTVKVKLPRMELTTTITSCCVNMVCNFTEILEVMDFFLGDKSEGLPANIEIISSEKSIFRSYELRVRPGTYRLNPKTGSLEGLEFEVWRHRG